MIREVETCHGLMHIPDTDICQYDWLAKTGLSPEYEDIDTVCKLLDELPKGVAIDCGANFGVWTLPLSRHATKVYAVEPQWRISKLLARSVVSSGLDNVTLLSVALSDKTETLRISDLDLNKPTNFGGLSIGVDIEGQLGAPMREVSAVRLDDITGAGDEVNFIKIDVEGYEDRVLRGAVDTIARCRPLMFVEVVHGLSDSIALQEQIRNMGYVLQYRKGNVLCVPI
jgi:FkbM family methyltransferase